MTRGTCRFLLEAGWAPTLELTLANGRRADVFAIGPKGEMMIVEVKSCRADFDVDQKWQDYLEYCDEFYFAVAEDFPREILPNDEGLIIADAFGGAIVQPSPRRALAGGRRKALLIRAARHAAFRAV